MQAGREIFDVDGEEDSGQRIDYMYSFSFGTLNY